jgi:hypothetical protein
MKIVMSRKGFDSGTSGKASPILANGRLVSIPIPSSGDPISYERVTVNGTPLGGLVEDLTRGRIARTQTCHLDPDLDPGSLPRTLGWRPAFGQIDAAQGHLSEQGIDAGDLFIFFGWFREAEQVDGRWRYLRGSQDLHVIYGWLHVGEVVALASEDRAAARWAPFADHPHLHDRNRLSNTLYVASDFLDLPGVARRPGGGLFREISESRILTDRSQTNRSTWELPGWFHPSNGTILSYNENPGRWRSNGETCMLSSAARGQEFVLSNTKPDGVQAWLQAVFND